MSEKLNVVTLVQTPSVFGGAERLAVDVTIGLDPERFNRYLCSTRSAPMQLDFDTELAEAGVEHIPLARRSRADLLAWRSFARFLRERRIDIVHSHLFGANVWGSLVGRVARVPVVVAHEHTWSYEGKPLRKLLDREVVGRLADTVIAVSEADATKMATIERVPAGKITVIRNGIRDPVVTAPREEVRRSLGVSDTAPLIAAVTVLRPQKRIDRLIEVAAIVRAQRPDVRVIVAGGGSAELERLSGVIGDLGLQDTVSLLGPRTDAPNLMAAADVGVFTSDFEGIPLALLEFMALGVPVVSTAVGGVPEVLADGRSGVLVGELDAHAVATALLGVLDLPEARRREMGACGREIQQRSYSFAGYMKSVVELYETMLARRGRRRCR